MAFTRGIVGKEGMSSVREKMNLGLKRTDNVIVATAVSWINLLTSQGVHTSAANSKVPKINETDGASPSIFYIQRRQSTSNAQTMRIIFFVLILLYYFNKINELKCNIARCAANLPYFSAYNARVIWFLHKTATTARYTLTRVIRNFICTHKISWNFNVLFM